MMDSTELPQNYLITPPQFDVYEFPQTLARLLDGADISCVRLALSSTDTDEISRAANACLEITMPRDIALVIDQHVMLVEKLGLDGVHLTDGSRNVRSARKELGQEAIVGSFCAASRHDGMSAGEAGADYIAFGPVAPTELGDGSFAEADLFAWWSDMIEVPVVAEGGLTAQSVAHLSDKVDFLAFGPEIWSHEDPLAAFRALTAR